MNPLVPKTLAAAATLAGLAAPAAAQPVGTGVQIYGFLKVDVERVRTAGPGQTVRLSRLSNNLSVLGFRATEDLGDGLSAFAQIESNVRVDSGDGPFGGRNTAVGLRGSLGQVLLGVWETPLRFVSVYAVDPFTAGIFASNSILGNGFAPPGGAKSDPHSFDRRQPNLVQYWLPDVNGFAGRLAHAFGEEKTAAGAPALTSALVSYQSGPLYAAYGLEFHKDYFGAGTRDSAHRIGGAYTLGATRVAAVWERLSYEPGATMSLSRKAWQLALTHSVGLNVWRASYVRAQRTGGNATPAAAALARLGAPGTDSGASQVSLGWGYRLSRRTEIWAAYTRLRNGASASYNLSANAVPGLTPGQDPSGLGLGITHSF